MDRPRTAVSLAAAALLAGSGMVALSPSSAHAADPVTIASIQGTGATSPVVDKAVTTTPSVVTAVYGHDEDGLRGFVIQTPGTGGSHRDLRKPSDAIFVYAGSKDAGVKLGDLVSVTGTVTEYQGLTEIGGSLTITHSEESHAAVKPVSGIDWAATSAHRENLESMLFSSTDTFSVSDTYPLLHKGGLALSAGSAVAVQPTDVGAYGSARAKAQANRNAARSVALDDGSNASFFASKTDPNGGTVPYLTRNRDVRVGDRAKITAPVIVDYRSGAWTFNPTAPITAGHEIAKITNAKPELTPSVGGRLSVASFNVLNYFPTTGQGRTKCTGRNLDTTGSYNITYDCDVRGAWDAADFGRQEAKIVSAINRLNPSVAGLMEIENSIKVGGSKDHAARTLVAALNAKAGYAKWAYVKSSAQLQPTSEQDVITNALIYQPSKAKLLGKAYADGADATDSGPFADARTPIAAAFAPRSGGAATLVAVNHFKSKGSPPKDASDPDAEHGQGAWNATRTAQAKALLRWVPKVQKSSGAKGVALIGDFNSYTHEDPLRALAKGGYHNAAKPGDRSYVYAGLSGSLDHVLLNKAATKQLRGSGVWNINSIESDAREYSEYKTTAVNYYRADAYRASDHDPVIIGLAVPKG